MSAPPCVLDTPLYIFAPCGKLVQLHEGEDADGALVTLWDSTGGDSDVTRWRVERAGPSGEGYFHIVSCRSGRAWCNPGGCTNGAGIVTWDQARADDSLQVFFEPAERQGFWYILFRDGRKSAQVLRESEENGAAIATWSKESRPHHWWRFEVYTRTCSVAWDMQWKGFGCSLCWWANALNPETEQAAAYADLLFSANAQQTLNYNGREEGLPSLGLNVIRYNIGGGGSTNKWNKDAPEYKDIKGFWAKPWSEWNPKAEPDAWDWGQDYNQRGWLSLAKERVGAGLIVQAFSDSPMHWMTISGSTHGASRPKEENFQPIHAGWHANYLAQVAVHARDHWGINFDSLEPFNEPNEDWWSMATTRQEGCHMTPGTQAAVLRELHRALHRVGLRTIKIACSDENSHRRAKETWEVLSRDVEVAKLVGLVCVHSYEGLNPARDTAARVALRHALQRREVWMTEYGDGEGSGIELATTIMHDIHYLRCTCWCYWQPIEPFSSWGLLNVKYGSASHATATWVYSKYWVFATFTQAIRPGMFILCSNAVDTVFAFDRRLNRLVVIVLNCGAAQNAEFDLRAFGAIDRHYKLTYTAFDGSALLKDLGSHPTQPAARRISVSLPAESVVAFSCGAFGLPPCALGVPVYIVAAHCGKVAHLHAEEDANGARVTLWDNDDSAHMRWRVERAGEGFRIISCHSGRAWCNPGGCKNGAGVVTWDTGNTSKSLEVCFEPAELDGHWYVLFVAERKSVHVLREDKADGAVIATWTQQRRPHHWWRFQAA